MAAAEAPWGSRLGGSGRTGFSPHSPPSLNSEFGPLIKLGGCDMTPAIGADRCIYYVSRTRESISRLREDGVFHWRFIMTQERGPFSGSLALHGGAVLAYTQEGFAVCLDMETGKERWARKFAAGGCALDMSAAVAQGGAVVLPGKDDAGDSELKFNRTLFVLDAKTGKDRWKVKVRLGLANVVPCFSDGGLLVFQTISGEVACHDLADGSLKWMSKPSGQTSTGGAVACKETGYVYATVNLKAKKEWNKPKGGRGALRVFDLKTGEMKFEFEEPNECNALPIVAPVGPDKRLLVIYGLGPNPSTWKDPLGDTWPAIMCARDARTGEHVWYSDYLNWLGPGPGGTDGQARFKEQQGVCWSQATACADGRVFVGWHGCSFFELEGATGKILCDIGDRCCFHAGAAVARDLLVVASIDNLYIFRNRPVKGDVVRDLALPLSESGVEHFWPSKMYNKTHTEFCELPATTDISKRPQWVAADIDRNPKRIMMLDFYHKTAIVDSQRNIYVATNQSRLMVIRPDGTIRGTVDCGTFLGNPCLHDRYLYIANGSGYMVKVDIESLEVVVNKKYTDHTASDSWNPIVCEKQGILLAVGMLRYQPPGQVGGNLMVYGLRADDCSVVFANQLPWITYNFLPSVFEEEDKFIFSDNAGGMYCWKISDGTTIWQDPTLPENTGAFTTGHCASGPNGVVYNAYNLAAGPFATVWNLGQGSGGIVQANVIETGERKWQKHFDFECHVAPVVVPKPAGSDGVLVVVPQGCQGGFGVPPEGVTMDDDGNWPTGDAWEASVAAFDGETGDELWRFTAPVWRHYEARGSYANDYFLPDCFGSPTATAEGNVYVIHWSGVAYCLEGATGKVLAEVDVGSSSQSAVVILPGTVLLPVAYNIIAIRDERLEAEWLERARAAGDRRADPRLWFSQEQVLTEDDRQALDLAFHVSPKATLWPKTTYTPMPAPTPAYSKKTFDARMDRLMVKAGLPPRSRAPPEAAPGGEEAQLWEVVGGGKAGGINVRKEQGLKSEELGRLGNGARVRQVALKGERLHYSKVSGEGPEAGWVSLTFKGAELVKRV